MAETWSVEARSPGSMAWTAYVDRIDREAALLTAEVAARLYPEWTLRLLDNATADVVHLDGHGKPLADGVMVPDRRTPEEVLADLAAERYEASLDRGWDL